MENKKLICSIFMITTSFYPELPGGAERQLEYLSSYLSQQHLRVTVLTRRLGGLKWKEAKDGYDIIRLPYFGPNKIKSLVYIISLIVTVFLKRKSFDILHAHSVYSPALAAVFAGKLVNKKTIVRFRSSGNGSELLKSKDSIWGAIRMLIIKYWADYFIVLTNEMRQELIEAGYHSEKIISMSNGVDIKTFSPLSMREKNGVIKFASMPDIDISDKTLLIYTGRLDKSKNLPMMLRALRRAIDHCPNICLFIIGDGEERTSLLSLVDELGIKPFIRFVGSVSDVREYLQLTDIFLLSSSDEGISNSLIEAMACGLACISTDVGAARDIFDNGKYGILIEPDNDREMSDAIIKLVKDENCRNEMGELARKRILDNYSIAVIGERYIDLYNSILYKQS